MDANTFDNLKIYPESLDIASPQAILLLDKIDQLWPKNSLSLGDFLSLFSTIVTEYDSIAHVALDPEIKKLKLQQCMTGDKRLVNEISILRIATKATGKPVPLYEDHITALTEACNTHDAIDISKLHAKSTNRRKKNMKVLVDGGANGGIAGTIDSCPLNSTFNCRRSVKVTSLGERM